MGVEEEGVGVVADEGVEVGVAKGEIGEEGEEELGVECPAPSTEEGLEEGGEGGDGGGGVDDEGPRRG